jgi:hypothetical protein
MTNTVLRRPAIFNACIRRHERLTFMPRKQKKLNKPNLKNVKQIK